MATHSVENIKRYHIGRVYRRDNPVMTKVLFSLDCHPYCVVWRERERGSEFGHVWREREREVRLTLENYDIFIEIYMCVFVDIYRE